MKEQSLWSLCLYRLEVLEVYFKDIPQLKLLVLLLILVACTAVPEDDGTVPASLHQQPITIEANPEGGYTVNSVTGDTIKPLINSLGDTVHTGVPIPVIGKVIYPDNVAKPRVVKALSIENLEKHISHPNRHIIPKNIPTFPVDQSQLKMVKFGEGNQDFVLTNSTGDTIPSGVSIPTKGKVIKAIQPKPIKALPPAFKDVAITTLQYMDVDQGMSSSYVTSILEDKGGHLWFGTFTGGVSVYDGDRFTHFTEEEGLSDNRVRSILEDKHGNLWFGTWGGGVSVYDGDRFTHFTEKEGLSNNIVLSIIEDKYGSLWFGTWGGGVSVYDGDRFTHFTEKEGLSHNRVRSIAEDKHGKLWFGTWGGGVSVYDGEQFTYFAEEEGLSNNFVRSIVEDKHGKLWFGTWGGGVSVYDGEQFTHFTEEEGLSNNSVSSILEDKHGNLWFGTWGGGASVYDGEQFIHLTEKEGLSNNFVRSIEEDKHGNLWFGTWGGGVSVYDGDRFTHFTEKEGISHNRVRSMLEDKHGKLWFGTWGGGVSVYDGEGFSHITEEEGLSNNFVRSILEDKHGKLWFGTWGGGLSVYDGEGFSHITEEEGLSNNFIRSIVEDNNGNLWFGTNGGGLSVYDGERFIHITEEEGLSNNSISSIVEDKRGNLWFGTIGGGVSLYDGEHFIHFTEKEGLSNNSVSSIVEDQHGNLWFGTFGGGVSVYDGDRFTHITEREGLSHNRVRSIMEDNDGIWVSTEKGLTQIVLKGGGLGLPSQEDEGIALYTFEKSDGLIGMDFYANSSFIDNKNRAWWGSGKSLTILDLDKHKISKSPPVIYLKQLDINEQFIDYRNITDNLGNEISFNGVQRFENYPLFLELPYNKNHLTFHFVAIDWKAPHKIHYSHRMLGLNDNWSNPTREAKADYRNLPYGTYTFQIRAIGESGEWSVPFDYTFTINPPWGHTWWAYLGYTLLFLLALRIFSKYRERHLRAEKEKLEQTVEERTAEVVAEKKEADKQREEADKQRQRSDDLLLNILPEEVAEELKAKGSSEAKQFSEATVLFTDFKEFTNLSEKLTPKELVSDLNHCFTAFDEITHKHRIEKIKTIGDAYMAAGGLPTPNKTHAKDVVLGALEIRDFIEKGKSHKIANNQPFFEIRIGIHTGPLVAGIVGVKKFQYDIWGDTVNTASRMESNGEVGKVNISQFTYELLKEDPDFEFEHRGKISAKGKGEIEMLFVSLKNKND